MRIRDVIFLLEFWLLLALVFHGDVGFIVMLLIVADLLLFLS